ncbi:hypothetical protein [Bacillus sp. FJAT-29937]|uniref:hypothetical protein n=1 Tax=Bacillus sp. FJAT-29937 TaxID=1720553 RepID=UPI00083144C8|nr:hypothetical protein [Bacillus sp. FJAT-29937]
MEKYIEVMKKSLELSETILEGLRYIQKLLSEGKSEQSVFMFEEVLQAYATIERNIEPVVNELNNESISAKQAEFSHTANLVVTAYEEKNYAKVKEIIQFTLVPRYKRLKEELELAFNPFIVS